jgi:hypothetical protein
MPSKGKRTPPPSYVDVLLAELHVIETEFVAIVEDSEIFHDDPNTPSSRIVFIGASTEHWRPSNARRGEDPLDTNRAPRELAPA